MGESGTLTVEIAGETRAVEPGGALTFGRAADLVVDDANPYLHRVVGRFFWHGDAWWLENLGSYIELTVVTEAGAVARLPVRQPGAPPVISALPAPRFDVRFEAGAARYELAGLVSGNGFPHEAPPTPSEGVDTAMLGKVKLTAEERRLLLVLAEPCLRDPTCGPQALASSAALAHRLGWTESKFRRKLDYLCTRLTKAGARGLQGELGVAATNRRWRLVQHAINARLIKPADVAELDQLAG